MWTFCWSVAAALTLAAVAWLETTKLEAVKKTVQQLEQELREVTEKRRSERVGRIKAEKKLHQLGLVKINTGEEVLSCSTGIKFPWLEPIGILHSCFTQRNGTPRQPLLVDRARAKLVMRRGIPHEAFEGLQDYSHCWILYIFHRNTNLHQIWGLSESAASEHKDPHQRGVRAKVRVPRLNGATMGVFATRTPHRPVPIGLSCARVSAIQDGEVLLQGIDIVDGSPVLDIKPYVPFCDAIEHATAPEWVTAQSPAQREPLHVSSVHLSKMVQKRVEECWAVQRRTSLYPDSKQFLDLVVDVLSRDIRSVHQRARVEAADPDLNQRTDEQCGQYHVVLEGVDVSYDISNGVVVVRNACNIDA